MAHKIRIKTKDLEEALMGLKSMKKAPMKEASWQDWAPIVGTLVGVGGTLAASIVKALMAAKTPEEKAKVLQAISGQIKKSKGVDESIDINEASFQDYAPILGTLLGVGGTLAVSIVKALKAAKTPEDKAKVLQAISGQIKKSKGQDQ